MSKLKNDLLKIGPQQQHMLPLLVDVLDLVSWLATACRLFQFQKSTVTMGELKSLYRKKSYKICRLGTLVHAIVLFFKCTKSL